MISSRTSPLSDEEHIALTGDYVWTDSNAITGFGQYAMFLLRSCPRRLQRAVLNKPSADPFVTPSASRPARGPACCAASSITPAARPRPACRSGR